MGLAVRQIMESNRAAAPVAQLDSASVSGTEGCRFEPCRAYLWFDGPTELIAPMQRSERVPRDDRDPPKEFGPRHD